MSYPAALNVDVAFVDVLDSHVFVEELFELMESLDVTFDVIPQSDSYVRFTIEFTGDPTDINILKHRLDSSVYATYTVIS